MCLQIICTRLDKPCSFDFGDHAKNFSNDWSEAITKCDDDAANAARNAGFKPRPT